MEKSSSTKEYIRQLKKQIDEAPYWGAGLSIIWEEYQNLLRQYPNLDPIQDNCKHGYVLPDRCRYRSYVGCDCGAYPPIRKEKT